MPSELAAMSGPTTYHHRLHSARVPFREPIATRGSKTNTRGAFCAPIEKGQAAPPSAREVDDETPSIIATTSSVRYPWRRAKSTNSLTLTSMALCSGVPTTVIPRPRRNSRSPSSRRMCMALRTVFLLTPRTAAMSLTSGRRSPGAASPSAIARRMSAATWSWRGMGPVRSTATSCIVLSMVVLYCMKAGRQGPSHRSKAVIHATPEEWR